MRVDSRARILIADDDHITRHVLRTMLRECEFEVLGEAFNGGQVLELCQRLQPNVLCLDLDMPKMNGMDVLDEVKDEFPDLIVVIISAVATQENVRNALRRGADGFVVKPLQPGKLTDTIKGCLRRAHFQPPADGNA